MEPQPEQPSSQEPKNDRRGKIRIGTEPLYASPFTIMGRVRSFRHALLGLVFVLRSQHNAWLHALATVLALVLGAVLQWMGVKSFTPGEWCALAVAITVV